MWRGKGEEDDLRNHYRNMFHLCTQPTLRAFEDNCFSSGIPLWSSISLSLHPSSTGSMAGRVFSSLQHTTSQFDTFSEMRLMSSYYVCGVVCVCVYTCVR